MAISKRLRYEVLRRDDFTCRYCHATDVPLTVDHVVPLALGGGSEPENLVTACAGCNAGKTSSSPDAPLVEAVSDDALRWAAAMKQAADVQRKNEAALDEYCARFYDAWAPRSLPNNWRNTISTWFEMGIEIEVLHRCVDIALAQRGVEWRWRYFCGVVWRRVNERQDIARDLLSCEGGDE